MNENLTSNVLWVMFHNCNKLVVKAHLNAMDPTTIEMGFGNKCIISDHEFKKA
jgi:hypothetical protein